MKNLKRLNFDLTGTAMIFKRTLCVIVIGGLIFIVQSCAVHYVADVPVGIIEVRPAIPYAGAVWIDGGWVWRGGHHTQVGGHWDRPRGGREMQPGEWKHGPRGNYWVRGRRR